MTRFVPLAAACLSGWLAAPTAAAAPRQQPALPEPAPKSAAVTSTTDVITIDGVLDEPAWRAAPAIGDLTQRQPDEGRPPTQRTEVRLLYDRDSLYVGVVAHDAEPERVIERTEGVTASFIKELLRRSALNAADEGGGAADQAGAATLRVTDAHMHAALDILLDDRNRMTRVLLGARTDAPPPEATTA